MMDPQVKSILTSVLLAIATAGASWAAARGIIPSADQNTIANDAVGAVFALGAMAIAWYKQRQVAPKALIQQVNAADNGVKVVAATEPAKTVHEPLKGG